MMREAILGTMRTTGMIMLILIAAWYLNFVLSLIGVNRILNGIPRRSRGCRLFSR